MSIYSDGHGYCFSCQSYIPAEELASAGYDVDTSQPKNFKSFKRQENNAVKIIPQSEMGLYNERRGISVETALYCNYWAAYWMGQPVEVCRVIRNGEERQKVRTMQKQFLTLGGSIKQLIGQERYPDGGDLLVITEGEYDMMSVIEACGQSQPCVSLPSGAQSAKSALEFSRKWLTNWREVCLWLDADEVGQDAVEAAKKTLLAINPRTAITIAKSETCKDANDVLTKEGAEAVRAVLKARKSQHCDAIKTTLEDAIAAVMDRSATEDILPYPTGWDQVPAINDLDGLKKGEIVMIAGETGRGKSTLGRELVVHLRSKGQKVGVISYEERYQDTLYSLISVTLKRKVTPYSTANPKTQQDVDDELLAVKKLMSPPGTLAVMNPGSASDPSKLDALNTIHEMISLGMEWIYIDHISLLLDDVSRKSMQQASQLLAQDEFISEVGALARKFGIGFIVLTQVTKDKKRTTLKIDDIKGSGGITAQAYSVIAINRRFNPDDEIISNTMELVVLKNRRNGQVEHPGYLYFDRTKWGLTPSIQPDGWDGTAEVIKEYDGKKGKEKPSEDYGF